MTLVVKGETGRRARKAREIRDRIAQVALGLFLERGFDATTLDAIAEAADISRRTFFHYYASKEAILDTVDEGFRDTFKEELALAAPGLPPILAVRDALLRIIENYSEEEAVALDRLMHSTEALRARKQANYVKQEKALLEALCEIWPDPGMRSSLKMVAMIGIGAMRLATDQWRADPHGRPLAEELKLAFADLRGVLGADAVT